MGSLDPARNTFATTLRQRSFFIPPGKLCFSIQTGVGDRPDQHIFLGGRSDWATILHDSFGDSIDVLLSRKNVADFAHFLYCGFYVINDGKGVDHPDPWGGMSATTRERQMSHMSFASKRLPELATVFTVGESNVFAPSFGVTESDTFPDNLKDLCPCERCIVNFGHPFRLRNPGNTGCLEAIAVTVFEYIWMLSWLDIDESIYPSATGLRRLYFKTFQQFAEPRKKAYTPYKIKSRFLDQPLVSPVIQLFTGLGEVGWSSGSSNLRVVPVVFASICLLSRTRLLHRRTNYVRL